MTEFKQGYWPRYFEPKKSIFGKMYPKPQFIFRKNKIDNESWYSCESPMQYRQLHNIIKPNKNMVVYDATTNVGGFSLQIAPYVSKVISYEINPITFESLEKNIKALGLKNVYAFNTSFELPDKVPKNAILMMDPPWGMEYAEKIGTGDRMTLKLGKVDVLDIINKSKFKKVYFKIPRNYDLVHLWKKARQWSYVIYSINGFDGQNYLLIAMERE